MKESSKRFPASPESLSPAARQASRRAELVPEHPRRGGCRRYRLERITGPARINKSGTAKGLTPSVS